ncbi:MAG: hypothetical protein QN178_01800 [Armatimonadota bacterium]|nr:hypothetical protein [Armatimonadota bacterium]
MTSGSPGAALERTWRIAHLVWLLGVGFASAVWVGLPLLLVRAASPGPSQSLIVVVFSAVGIVDVGLGWWFKRRALDASTHAQARSLDEAAGAIASQSLVAAVMPVTPAVLGAFAYVFTGSLAALSLLCAVGIGGSVFLRPRLEEWQETLRGISISDARRPS